MMHTIEAYRFIEECQRKTVADPVSFPRSNKIRKGKTMSKPIIDDNECIGCGICVDACSFDALMIVSGVAQTKNADACIGCGVCKDECPMDAIADVV